MTRARRELTIHLNSDFLDGLSSEAVEHIEDKNDYLPPEELAEQKELYKEYLSNIRSQLKAQLDNIEVVDELPDKKQLH